MSELNKTMPPKENSFIEGLARQLGITANAKNIFAEPVERDGVTVIPVAKAAYGFGGGGKKENEEGLGGGGGIRLTPVGYIEIKDGETCFRPTRHPLVLVPAIFVATSMILISVWKIRELFDHRPG